MDDVMMVIWGWEGWWWYRFYLVFGLKFGVGCFREVIYVLVILMFINIRGKGYEVYWKNDGGEKNSVNNRVCV